MRLIILCLFSLLFYSCISQKEYNDILHKNILLQKELDYSKCRIDSIEHVNRYLQSDLNNALFELNE